MTCEISILDDIVLDCRTDDKKVLRDQCPEREKKGKKKERGSLPLFIRFCKDRYCFCNSLTSCLFLATKICVTY